MIKIEFTEDLDIVKSIITSEGLWELSYGQDSRKEGFEVERNGFAYLLIKYEEAIIGCIQIRPLTKILLESHIYIKKKYWGTGLSDKAVKESYKFAKYQLGFKQVFTDVPLECRQVQNLLKRTGWVRSGIVKQGVIFNNKLQDLLFYSFNLSRV